MPKVAPLLEKASAQAPITLTDRTCGALTGVPWDTMREWCVAHGVAIAKIGRRSVVRLDDYLSAFDIASGRSAPRPAAPWNPDEIIARAAGVK